MRIFPFSFCSAVLLRAEQTRRELSPGAVPRGCAVSLRDFLERRPANVPSRFYAPGDPGALDYRSAEQMNGFALLLMLKAALPKSGRLYLSDDAGTVLLCFSIDRDRITIVDHDGKELVTVAMPFLH
jgi:hypothetical protein